MQNCVVQFSKGAEVLGADFSEADLRDVNMRGAVLQTAQTIFKGAMLDRADMRAISYTDIPQIRKGIAAPLAASRDWKTAAIDENLRLEVESASNN